MTVDYRPMSDRRLLDRYRPGCELGSVDGWGCDSGCHRLVFDDILVGSEGQLEAGRIDRRGRLGAHLGRSRT